RELRGVLRVGKDRDRVLHARLAEVEVVGFASWNLHVGSQLEAGLGQLRIVEIDEAVELAGCRELDRLYDPGGRIYDGYDGAGGYRNLLVPLFRKTRRQLGFFGTKKTGMRSCGRDQD